jgi:hypothetical protein
VRPSVDELKRLWLHAYARSSFHEADEWLDVLSNVPADSSVARALICAAVVAYARPFSRFRLTATEKVAPLRGIAPPKQLSEKHQDAIDLRNKLIGHKDATPASRHTNTPNVVLIHNQRTQFEVHTTRIDSMDESFRLALKELCAFFVAHCETVMKPITKAWFPEINKERLGLYELIISEPPNEWIRPFRPSTSAT